MLGQLSQDVTKPKEAVVHSKAFTAAGSTPMISFVPCIGASRIDIFIESTEDCTLTITMSAAAGEIEVTTSLGSITASTATAYTFGSFTAAAATTGALGQVYSVAVTGAGDSGTATIWTCARF
jgi:hypothetical protein